MQEFLRISTGGTKWIYAIGTLLSENKIEILNNWSPMQFSLLPHSEIKTMGYNVFLIGIETENGINPLYVMDSPDCTDIGIISFDGRFKSNCTIGRQSIVKGPISFVYMPRKSVSEQGTKIAICNKKALMKKDDLEFDYIGLASKKPISYDKPLFFYNYNEGVQEDNIRGYKGKVIRYFNAEQSFL